jgi:isoquinoline 1-oxidoreductase subunit beta
VYAHPTVGLSCRHFKVGAAGLTFAIASGMERAAQAATQAPAVAGTTFSPWASIATNGEVSIICPAAEMGQGLLTSLP